MKYSCNVVKDLLPLYVDNICSGESKEIVEQHLSECADCKAYYLSLHENNTLFSLPVDQKRERQKAQSFLAIKKSLRTRQFLAAILSISVLASAIIYLIFNISLEAYVGVLLSIFIIKAGIELIKSGAHKGIQKILQTAGIQDIKNITSETVAFTIVPRLNAAGRLETPETAIKILISDNDIEIEDSVKKLNELNELRQVICDETFQTADEMYKKDSSKNRKGIVLFNKDWHLGIIGIVASKLVEKYNKPVFLMTSDTNSPDIIRCSCRSIQGLNVHSVLSEHKETFEGFGGHKMAAGFSFDTKKIKTNSK